LLNFGACHIFRVGVARQLKFDVQIDNDEYWRMSDRLKFDVQIDYPEVICLGSRYLFRLWEITDRPNVLEVGNSTR